jgi:hypothetical protein
MALIEKGSELMACTCTDEKGGPKVFYWAPRALRLQELEAHELPVVLCMGCQSAMVGAGAAPDLVRRKARVTVYAHDADGFWTPRASA